MNNSEIRALLTSKGFNSAEISGTDGGKILLMDAGARVLRLTGESGHDFLWLNDSFVGGDPEEIFRKGAWRNFGGDRTWIAPEAELFISDLSSPNATYKVPESFDPGSHEIKVEGDGVRISGEFEVENLHLGGKAKLSLDKIVTPVPNPIGSMSDVEYIGYRQSATLRLLSDIMPGYRFGMWDLTQLRATGDILVPVTNSDAPRDYFGSSNYGRVAWGDGVVSFQIDAAENHKIGIKAAALTGRAGFVKDCGDGIHTLVVRNFNVDPSALYVDVPWDDLDDFGYAFQAFNDDGTTADFGELEYHTPAIGDSTGQTSYTDESMLWAFKGDDASINNLIGKLLFQQP